MPISAVYRKGVIKPLDKIELEENERIEIEIKRKNESREITKKIAGSLKIEDEKLIEAIVESEEWV